MKPNGINFWRTCKKNKSYDNKMTIKNIIVMLSTLNHAKNELKTFRTTIISLTFSSKIQMK